MDIREIAERKGMSINELASFAGKQGKGKPKKFKVQKGRKCNEKCQLFPVCFAKYISHTQYNGRCALAEMPERIQDIVKKAYLKGEEGLNELLLEFFITLFTDALTKDYEEKKKFLELMIKVKKALYGEKQKVIQEGTIAQVDLIQLLEKAEEDYEKIVREWQKWREEMKKDKVFTENEEVEEDEGSR